MLKELLMSLGREDGVGEEERRRVISECVTDMGETLAELKKEVSYKLARLTYTSIQGQLSLP